MKSYFCKPTMLAHKMQRCEFNFLQFFDKNLRGAADFLRSASLNPLIFAADRDEAAAHCVLRDGARVHELQQIVGPTGL